MTREEAKEELIQSLTDNHIPDPEAVEMAIKALEQEPCDVFDEYGNYKYPGDVELTEPNTATSVPCEDAISRQAVIDAMYALCNTGETLKENPWRDNPHIDAITDAIEDLPLVHSQPNKEDIHREREQAYMCGYEDGSRKYRTEQSEDAISRQAVLDIVNNPLNIRLDEIIKKLPPINPQPKIEWIPVSERLPELNRPLLVTTYHRVYYGHLISESGNYGYPVFRIHGLGDKNRDWVQETMSHEPYSLGRIDAWMYLDIPETYKVEPQESEKKE